MVRARHAAAGGDSITSTQPSERAILAVLLVGTFLAPLDSSIVNIALPRIAGELHASLTDVSWVATAYLLTTSALLLTMGRLGDMWGLRNLFVGGLAVSGLGSVACALTRSLPLLVSARVFQAVGASMLFAAGPAIVMHTFPPNRRGSALGIIALAVSAGLTVGPALGGLLVGAFGWPSIFLINIPIAAVAAVMGWRTLPAHEPLGESFDVLGAVLGGGALLSILIGLTEVEHTGLLSAEVGALSVANVVLGGSFIWWERRSRHPMVDLGLFRDRTFATGLAAATIAYLSMFGLVFTLPFFLLRVVGLDPRWAGVVMTTTPLSMAVFAPLAGRASDKLGSRGLAALGLVVMAAGLLYASTLTAGMHPAAIVGALALVGSGMSVFQTPNSASIPSATPRARAGIGSALIAEARNVGMALGIAFTAMIVAQYMGPSGVPGGEGLLTAAEAGRLVGGMSLALRLGAGLSVIAAALSWFLHSGSLQQVEPRGSGA